MNVIRALVPFLAVFAMAGEADWPQFRGPFASGIGSGDPPVNWDVKTGENILWKTPIPGLAHSSPAVWGNRVFLTTAVNVDRELTEDDLKVGRHGNIAPVVEDDVHEWRVLCLDKQTGKILWDRKANRGVPAIKRHTKSTHANPSPAVNGERVVAFFGSEGLYCYDMDGELQWSKDFGTLDSSFFQYRQAQWGFASSPVIHDGMVFVQCDVQDNSFVAALSLKDGKELWRKSRDEYPTWCTPTVYVGEKRTQLILNGFKHMGAYDAKTGEELWRLSQAGDIPTPTPVVAHGLAFLTSAHGPLSPIFAIRLDAKGDISLEGEATENEHIAWSIKRGGAYMQTPLVVGDYLYNCRDNGALTCYNAKTGEVMYQERLIQGGNSAFSASAVAAGDKIYYTSEFGEIVVIKAGPEFEVLARNDMDEICMATPAIADGALFIRTRGHLVAIGK